METRTTPYDVVEHLRTPEEKVVSALGLKLSAGVKSEAEVA